MSSAAQPDRLAMTKPVRQVVEVYKSHLDVGFTEMASKVAHDAIYWLLGVAADTAAALRAEGAARAFCWTVPAWIISEGLDVLKGPALAKLESAIAQGDISWHALPFTTHTELMDESLCAAATSLSRRLDQRFGLRTIAAKMTDVPGHSLGLVTALARSGVEFLHIGVNPMSPMPAVPPFFRWRDAHGNEVVVAYEPDYAREALLPDDDRLLLWRLVGDNMEVPSIHDIRANRAQARARFPDAEIISGRLDDWANGIRSRASALPVYDQEIGDSWIHGTGTDPWKTIRFRELMRMRSRWLRQGSLDEDSAFTLTKNLLLVSEHTWGVSFGAHLQHNQSDWDNDRFDRIRHRGMVKAAEASWQEQRDYLELATESLPLPQRSEVARRFQALPGGPVSTDGWQRIDPTQTIVLPQAQLRLNPQHGSISSFCPAQGQDRVSPGGFLGRLRYQTFDDTDCRRFIRQYSTQVGDWLLEEFAKRGLDTSSAQSRWHDPVLVSAWRQDRDHDHRIAIELAFAPEVCSQAGAPRRAQVLVVIPADGSRCDATLTWSGKRATRLPEALWWSFQLAVADPSRWRLEKIGTLIDPAAVVARGGRPLHAVDRGAFYQDAVQSIALLTPDAHLMAPGRPQLYEFTDEVPDLQGGLHLNLLNNLWGTNFPMWCGDDLGFRTSLRWAGANHEWPRHPWE